jgi:hypothetical protein
MIVKKEAPPFNCTSFHPQRTFWLAAFMTRILKCHDAAACSAILSNIFWILTHLYMYIFYSAHVDFKHLSSKQVCVTLDTLR